jgi:pteridine reductase
VGAVTARALASAGYDVLIHFHSNERAAHSLSQELAQLGGRAATFRADLSNREQLQQLVEITRSHCSGSLNLLVNNAASFDRVSPDQLDAASWDRALALNTTAPYLLTIGLAPELRRAHGSMVAIGCISARRPWKNYVPYSVSKAALVHCTKALAVALAPDVRCNTISPGTVLPPDDYDEAMNGTLRAKIPLDRFGTPDDVARTVLFLATSPFITGEDIALDGGRSLV